MREVRDRAQGVVHDFRASDEKGVLGKGVDLIYGQARFTGPKSLTVTLNDGGTREMEADQVFHQRRRTPYRAAH